MSLLNRFLRNRRGNVTATFGVSLVPLLGMAGVALDYTRGSSSRSDVQVSADNAALAAMIVQVPTIAQRESAGRAALSGNSGLATNATFDITSLKATVTIESEVEASFSKVLQVKAFKVAARAVAEKVFAGPPPCILALNANAAKSLLITGSAQYSALGCAIHANSNNGDALHIDSNTSVQASSFCAVGVSYVPTVLQPQARSYCEPLKDPFASLQAPAIGSCVATDLVVDPKQNKTLNPGTYCGSLTLKGTVTLNPGTYVITGRLSMTSQSVVSGTGVTFYLTGATAGITIDAGGTLDLSAPTGGSYAGILFFQDRTANPGALSSYAGGSTAKVTGSFYFPTQTLRVGGGSGVAQDVAFMPIIADKIEITGNIKAKADGVQTPFPLPKTESGVRLSS